MGRAVSAVTKEQRLGPGIPALLTASAAAAFALSAVDTVVGLQVYAITDSELALGLIGIAQFVPLLLLSFFTGSISDRYDRRKVFGFSLAIIVLSVCGLAVVASTSPSGISAILVFIAVIGVANAIGIPALRALPIDMAQKHNVQRVIAIRSLSFQLSLIAGPIVAAFANRYSTVLPFVISVVALIVAGLCLVGVPAVGTQKITTSQSPSQVFLEAKEGLAFVRKTPIIFGAITLDLFAVLFGGMVALLPAIVEKRLNFDDVDLGVGLLRAGFAGGAALCAAVLAWRPVSRRLGPVLFFVIAVFGVCNIVVGFTTSFVVAFIAIAVASAADQVSVFIRSAVVPLATPEAMRGRVLAVENVFISSSNRLGAFESGVTAAWFGLAPAVVIGGVATLVVVAAGTAFFPKLRDLDTLDDLISNEQHKV